MNHYKLSVFTLMSILAFFFTGCARNRSEIWDDTKTCGRHLSRGLSVFTGNKDDSRQVGSKEEFYWPEERTFSYTDTSDVGYAPFIEEKAPSNIPIADYVAPQPKDSPGDPGSPVPGIDSFRDPSTISGAANAFQTLHFEYNSSLIKGTHNQEIIQKAAAYVRSHPNTFVFIEGHTDNRGPEAYNLALGSRRANSVRNALIKEGVSPNNLFTISYGKERPIANDSSEDSWALNRRAEFKLYTR